MAIGKGSVGALLESFGFWYNKESCGMAGSVVVVMIRREKVNLWNTVLRTRSFVNILMINEWLLVFFCQVFG